MSACYPTRRENHLLKVGDRTIIRALVRDGLTGNQTFGIYTCKRQLYLGVHRINSLNAGSPAIGHDVLWTRHGLVFRIGNWDPRPFSVICYRFRRKRFWIADNMQEMRVPRRPQDTTTLEAEHLSDSIQSASTEIDHYHYAGTPATEGSVFI
jgi:hypothetical protein